MIKGIGIISVVIGHSFNGDIWASAFSETIRRFVYTYHLAIFFWVLGYLWKKKEVKQFIKSLIAQYKRFIYVGMVAVALIPFWNTLGVIEWIPYSEIPERLIKVMLYYRASPLVGAMWFCTWYSVASLFFYCINLLDKMKVPIIIASGVIGLILVYYKILDIYFLNCALLIQPIIYAGYYCRKKEVFTKMPCWLFVPTGIIILICNFATGYQIELSKNLGAFT